MFSHRLYYQLKPLIPRTVQILLRRIIVARKRKSCGHVWPIDEKAGTPPPGWKGWPDGKQFAVVLMHDVDTEKGHGQCLSLMRIDEEMGFRSSFNFVPERYRVSSEVRRILADRGFEVGVHGLKHDGKLFSSRKTFLEQAARINQYLKDWKSAGFVSPSMHRNFDWIHDLDVEYDASSFDTDPFEPQPEGLGTIFPLRISPNGCASNLQPPTVLPPGYVELPYTLPQDHTLFILMQERDISIWKKKLDWIAQKGGMALLITHPDYMSFNGKKSAIDEYPSEYYREFLRYIRENYKDRYWNALPGEIARFWTRNVPSKKKTTPQKQAVEIIDPVTDPRWDAFVENHPFGWICHLSGWKKVLEKSFPHMKGHYLALIDGKREIKAGLPLFEVKSWLTGKRLVSIPFATFSDPLVSNEKELVPLLDRVKHMHRELGCGYAEIRMFKYDAGQLDHAGIYQDIFKAHLLKLEGSIEDLKKRFHKTCVRKNIARANRNGLKLMVGETEKDWMDFYYLYVANRKRLGLPSHPYAFIRNIWQTFMEEERVRLLLAEWEAKVIGALILFKYKDRVSAEYLGTDQKYMGLYTNVFLFWEAIRWAFESGMNCFDFGRTSPNNRGLMEFKGHWGTRIIDLPIYYYPKEACNQKFERESSLLYRTTRCLCKACPESIHPLMGRLIYKHLG